MAAANNIKSYLILARPHHYVKNAFVLLPLFFGHKLTDPAALLNGVYAFLAFSFCASAIYSLNDLIDAEADRLHPQKMKRPVAAGTVTPVQAVLFSIGMIALSAAFCAVINSWSFFLVILGYFILNLLYCFGLKKVVLLDICCIGIGFVLRVVAGAAVASVPVSHWIIIITFLLALFLALAKRRDDVLLATQQGTIARKNIDLYNLEFISSSMVLMASVTVVSYILYTVSPEIIQLHRSDKLYLTGFWVLLGFLRYMQITFVEHKSGSPTLVLLKDYFLQFILAAWLVSFFILLYVSGGQ